MIGTWPNGVLCKLSRKRETPVDMIKGVLFFKFLGEVPLWNKGREDAFPHPNKASCICFLYRNKEDEHGSAYKGSFFFQNLRKGVLFFKNWEKEFCCCKNHRQSEGIPYLPGYLFALLAWKGRGEKVYSDSVSHKRRFVFKKIWEYISSIYRYKSCTF